MKVAYLGFATITVFASSLLGQEKPPYNLSKPTGAFAVGRTLMWWTDQSRRETAVPGDHPRGLQVLAYYPANTTSVHAEYYPGLADLGLVPETKLLARHFGSAWPAVKDGLVQSNSYRDAPFSKKVGKCPIVVFSPGGSAPATAYSAQLEELASHGYVVLGLNHPYDTALIIRPDHQLIPFVDQGPQQPGPPSIAGLQADRNVVVRWAADTRFALEQIKALSQKRDSPLFHHLDLSHVGVFGHSLGGKAAARVCQIDSRIGACLNEDGELFGIPAGSSQPVPSVIPDHPTKAPFVDIYVAEQLATDAQLAAMHVTREQLENWRRSKITALRSFLRSNKEDSYFVVIKRDGFRHGGFMDIAELGAIVSKSNESTAQSNLELDKATFFL